MKDFFLFPQFSFLGVLAFGVAVKLSSLPLEWYWSFIFFGLAGFFNYLVTYDARQMALSIYAKLKKQRLKDSHD